MPTALVDFPFLSIILCIDWSCCYASEG